MNPASTPNPRGIGHHRDCTPLYGCPGMEGLSPQALQQVAAYFQALSEPTRLSLLNLLRSGERNVGELAELCGFTAANVSRHLSLLMRHGLVVREARGTAVYYRIADPAVYKLCDLVCGQLERQALNAAEERRAFAAATRKRPAVGRRA